MLQLADASPIIHLQPLHRRHWARPFNNVQQDCECSERQNTNGYHHSHTNITFDFTLQDNEQLLWTSPNDTQQPTVSFKITPAPGQHIINMEKFADALIMSNCSQNMILQFKNNHTFQAARSSWGWVNRGANHSFIIVGDSQLCGSGSLRDLWAVSHASFEQQDLTIRLAATKKTWEEAAYSYILDFGNLNQILQKRVLGFDQPNESVLDLGTSWPMSLIDVNKSPLFTFKASCIDCGTKGSLAFSGHIAGNILEGITTCTLSVAPRGLRANLDLDIEFSGKWYSLKTGGIDPLFEAKIKPPFLHVPLAGGWDVPGILTLGPTLSVTAGFELASVEGEAKVSVGAAAIVPDNSIAKLDLVADHIVDSQGWIPRFETKPVNVDTKLTAEMTFFPLLSVNMSLILFPNVGFGSLPKHGVDLGIGLKIPTVKVEASSGYNTNGFCPNTSQPVGVNLDVSLGFSLTVDSWMNVFGVQKNLLENIPIAEKDDVFKFDSVCFPFGSAVSPSSGTISVTTTTIPPISSSSLLRSSSTSRLPSSTPRLSSSTSRPHSSTSRSASSTSRRLSSSITRLASSSSTLPRTTSPISQPPSSPTVLPPSRTCTSDCGWQWVASGAFGWFSANSWSLPTGLFQANAAGQRTLNTKCVKPSELEFQPASIPAGSEYVWEDWPLGSDSADSCCIEYFASATCERVLNGVVDRCDGLQGNADRTAFEVKGFRVYGCRGLYREQTVGEAIYSMIN